jgi:hypothetical protein
MAVRLGRSRKLGNAGRRRSSCHLFWSIVCAPGIHALVTESVHLFGPARNESVGRRQGLETGLIRGDDPGKVGKPPS